MLNTILVAKAMIDSNYKKIGVRLDSGDLAYYSR